MPEPCGNCDNCLNPPETRDARVDAQKALSCAYRTEQRFGVNYLIDVLRGKETDRILQFGHDRQSTFGIGKDLSMVEWRAIFRQLIAKGCLYADQEQFGSLKLTAKAKPYLKGELEFSLRKQIKPAAKKKKGSRTRKGWDSVPFVSRALAEALRDLRTSLAKKQSVPPYVIFSDASLIEMAEKRPQSDEDFLMISGVGDSKLKRYGRKFMKVIDKTPFDKRLDNRLSDAINETLGLHLLGVSANDIATKRDLNLSMVYEHFAQGIEAGIVGAGDVLSLEQPQQDEILAAFEDANTVEEGKVEPAFNALGGRYEIGILKCVLAESA